MHGGWNHQWPEKTHPRHPRSTGKESFARTGFWNAHLSFPAMRISRSISYTETPLQKKEQIVWRVR
jgi:hypothetical protein